MGKPIRLAPSMRERVWGRTRLSPWFPDSDKPIGEVWYLADQDLPLLVKILFTADRLSVQVHPADGEHGPRGKSEMWHILDAEPDAAIALGFRRPITRETLRESAQTGEIESLLHWMPVRAGETYFATAHTVHAIGPGIVLCEIQQNSDVTYRLWDYGRPRQLHLEEAIPIADLGVHPGKSTAVVKGRGREELVRSKHFVTELLHLGAGEEVLADPRPCHLWICLEGSATIGAEPCQAGEVWLVPEPGDPAAVKATGGVKFLRTWVP
ncbi:MAG TPA: class I mannose-6-phosphate isomerase [Bryobacteraceae bacterium]|nr:class I mannose-6-phosphate isomerase [Bryobacteraceae bacterium]